jgi:hypothetical protein
MGAGLREPERKGEADARQPTRAHAKTAGSEALYPVAAGRFAEARDCRPSINERRLI